jgi:hypothetical protein
MCIISMEGPDATTLAFDQQLDHGTKTATIMLGHAVSMAYLDAQGESGRTFSISELAMANIILGRDRSVREHEDLDFLKRVHIISITMEPGTVNGFPEAIGVHFKGIGAREYTSTGNAWNFVMPPNFKLNAPVTIFKSNGDEVLMRTWERDFGRWTPDNLDTLLVMQVPETEVVLLHVDHPVTKYLERKANETGTMLQVAQQQSTPNWRQISSVLFQNACAWIRENILNKSSKHYDLSTFQVTYDKMDRRKFNKLSPSCFEAMPITGTESVEALNDIKSKYANIVVQKPFPLFLKITFEYRVQASRVLMPGSTGM